jgi:ribosomal protein L29
MNKKIKDLKNKSLEELYRELKESYDKLSELKLQLAIKKLKDHQMIKKTKKHIARIWTLIHEKLREQTFKNSESQASNNK